MMPGATKHDARGDPRLGCRGTGAEVLCGALWQRPFVVHVRLSEDLQAQPLCQLNGHYKAGRHSHLVQRLAISFYL
jgi:hypothetical protein